MLARRDMRVGEGESPSVCCFIDWDVAKSAPYSVSVATEGFARGIPLIKTGHRQGGSQAAYL